MNGVQSVVRGVLGVMLGALAFCASASQMSLFEAGKTAWTIETDANAAPPVKYAAQELAETLKRVSDATFAVTNGVAGPKVVIGSLEDALTRTAAERAGLVRGEDDVVVLKLDGETFWILGDKPRSALYATYWFLQKELGVRWLWPGEDGAFYPKRASYSLPPGLNLRYQSPFRYRGLNLTGDKRLEEFAFKTWMTRNMMNTQSRGVRKGEEHLGLINQMGGHNVNLFWHKDLIKTHPEYFAEVKGERTIQNICLCCYESVPIIAADLCKNIARSPVKVDKIGLSLMDNGAYCTCAKCSAVDVSTRFFRYLDKLCTEIKKTYPDLKFGTIAYQGYRPVPKCSLSDDLLVQFCTHWRCNLHRCDDKTCPKNVKEFAVMDEWDNSDLPRVGEYGYEFDIFARNGLMLPIYSVIEDAIKSGYRRKHVLMWTEIGLSRRGGPEITCSDVRQRVALHEYLSLLWDPTRTLDDWMSDFCRTAYGPAAEAMMRYFKTMDRAWCGQKDVHISILCDGINSVMSVMTDETRLAVNEAFKAADAALAGDGNERFRKNVFREKQLYGQWEDLLALRTGSDVTLQLPNLTDAQTFPAEAVVTQALSEDRRPTPVKVRCAWTGGFGETNGALVVEFSGVDAAVLADEASVELGLANAAEKWTFKAKNGQKAGAVRMTDLGVPDPVWKPQGWSVTAADGRLTFVIPFADVGVAPIAKQDWEAKFVFGGRRLPAKVDVNATLVFVNKSFAGRRMMFWTGNDKAVGQFPGWVNDAARVGFTFFPCRRVSEFQEAFPGASVMMFWAYDPQHMISTYYPMIGEAVKNGATIVLCQAGRFPLSKAFDGLTWKSDGWTELTGVAARWNTRFEGLRWRPYGKGKIVLMTKGLFGMNPPEAAAVVLDALETPAVGASAVPVAVEEQEKPAEKPLKVLMIGNSYSICVLKEAPQIAKSMGKKLDIASAAIGGCSLSRHANNLNATNLPYLVTCNYCGVTDVKKTPLAAVCVKEANWAGNLRSVIAADKWDVITIQQASHASWNEKTYHPHVDKLIAAIRELAPQAEIRIQQTWSYCKGDSRICNRATMGPGSWEFDQTGMYERLTANYRKIAEENRFKVIPTGLAVQKFRQMKNIADYEGDVVGNVAPSKEDPKKLAGDKIHLNSRGEYLQGLVWVGALFNADVTTCAYKPTGMEDDLATALRNCAAVALKEGVIR